MLTTPPTTTKHQQTPTNNNATTHAGKSDPLAEVFTTPNHRYATKHISSCLEPTWDETFYLPVLEKDQVLHVEVFDRDAVNASGAITFQIWKGIADSFGAKDFMVRADWRLLAPDCYAAACCCGGGSGARREDGQGGVKKGGVKAETPLLPTIARRREQTKKSNAKQRTRTTQTLETSRPNRAAAPPAVVASWISPSGPTRLCAMPDSPIARQNGRS